jgi:hypothetical protein
MTAKMKPGEDEIDECISFEKRLGKMLGVPQEKILGHPLLSASMIYGTN